MSAQGTAGEVRTATRSSSGANGQDLESLGRLVRAHHRSDLLFSIAGLFVLFVSLGLLATLLIDLLMDGAPRLDGDFLVNFPSRNPANADF